MSRTIYLELVAGSRMAEHLSVGGLFVMDNSLALQDACEIIVFNDGGQIELPAKCVYVDGNGGVGLELIGFNEAIKTQLADLIAAGIEAATNTPATEEQPALGDEHGTEEHEMLTAEQLTLETEDHPALLELEAQPALLELEAQPALLELESEAQLALLELEPEPARDTVLDLGAPQRDTPTASTLAADDEEDERRKTLHEQLRNLPLHEQVKLAKKGGVTERILLERTYGKNVWEPLLRNPGLTAPEVARIARMGALPRPLLEIIFGNGAWLQIPEVRRALLSNPRLGTDQIIKLLRMLTKQELKLATMQTGYSMAVRSQAKTMLKQEGG